MLSIPKPPRWWIRLSPPGTAGRATLLCLPHAGAQASAFRAWAPFFASDIDVYALQLPGRGSRFTEAPITDMDTLIGALVGTVDPHLDRPLMLLGHSLGALIAFELARALARRDAHQLQCLCVAGTTAPTVERLEPRIYQLPDGPFLDQIARANGMPAEIRENAELLTVVLRALRADYTLLDTYEHLQQEKLRIPIMAFGGRADATVPEYALQAWEAQTAAGFTLSMYDGGHFFLHDDPPRLRMIQTLHTWFEHVMWAERKEA